MAKADFRNYVTALVAKSEASDAHDFWSTIFCCQLSFEDVCEVLSFEEVRKLRTKQPKSLAMLIIKSVEQAHLFTKYTGTFFTPMTNALRILTRVMPVVLEDATFTENLFWNNKIKDKDGKEVVYDKVGTEDLLAPLGELLMVSLLNATAHGRFCFLPSAGVMNLPEVMPGTKFVNPRILWNGGTGIPDNGNTRDASTDLNRIDLLRCFLACTSQPLFRPDALGLNKFVKAMNGTPNQVNVSFCHTLLNIVFAYDPSGSMPFTSYFTDAQEEVVDLSLQVLIACMDYHPLLAVRKPDEKVTPNAFWYCVENIVQPYDMGFVVNGTKNLMGNRLKAANTWISGSQKELNCHGALLLLLVKMLQRNPNLVQGILRQVEISDWMSMLLYIMYEDTEQRRGIIKPATCLLLQMSQNDSFCRVLNLPFTSKLPSALPQTAGTHADVLVVILHHIMNLNHDWLKPLYEQFLTILYNISPHCNLKSVAAASRLMQLVNIFSSPEILDNEPELAGLIVPSVEIVRNFLAFDYNGNLVVLYALLREAPVIHRIAKMMQLPDSEDESEEEDDDAFYLAPEVARKIPIELLLKLITSLAPKLNEFVYANKSYTEQELLQFLHRVRINNMPDCDPFEPKEYNSFDKVSDLITRWAWNSIFVSNMEPQMFDAAKVRLFQLTKIESLDPAPPPASTSTALVIGPSAALAGKPPLGLVQPVANDGKPATLLRIAIQKLIQIPVSEDEEAFWRIVVLPGNSAVSFEEVCQAITIAEGRALRWQQPVSMANLILKLVQRLELVALNPVINEYTAVNNILRILARVLPMAFETELPPGMVLPPDQQTDKKFADRLFWESKVKDPSGASFSVATSDGEAWGSKLIRVLAALACRPGFAFHPSSSSATLPDGVLGHKQLNPRLLWCGGLAVAEGDLRNSRGSDVDTQCVDVMRCLLTCFTETLYTENALEANKFIAALTNKPTQESITMCYSLLNITLSYDPSGTLPYTSYWTDQKEVVIAYALQVLLAVMNYGLFQGTNQWWAVIENLKSKRDLAYMSAGMLRLISNRFKAANTWLPMSQKELDFHAPLILLLVKLLEKNPDLRQVMALAVDMDELMASLLFIMYDDTVNKRGLLKPVTCILLLLSTDQAFCKMLSKPFAGTLPVALPKFNGNLIDLMVVVMHYVINLNEDWIKPIYEQFFGILFNVSPYCWMSSVVGSAKLLALLDVFSGIKVLQKSPEYGNCVVHGVEVINNFLSFDYANNRTLLYIVLRESAIFDRIQELTGPGGILQPRKAEIPLEMIQRLIVTLGPRLKEYCEKTQTTSDEEVMNFLARIQLTNMPKSDLPKPRHATRLEAAMTQWVWATIFGRNVRPQLWAVAPIKLIQVTAPAAKQLAITGPGGSTPSDLLGQSTRVRRAFEILTNQIVDVNDGDFWRTLFTSPFTFEELTESVPISVVRNLKLAQPISFATLVYKSVEQAHLFGKYSGDFYVPVCNALRILTRVMPILYETDPQFPLYAEHLLWQNKVFGKDGQEVGVQTKNWTEDEPGPEKSLGQILANALLHAALHPGFSFLPTSTTHTLPERVSEKSYSNPRHIWTGGLGVSDTGNLRNASVDANRIDLLRCIVSCSADTLYQADPLRPNKFIKAMTGELHMFNVTFCYSLLNTVFSYDPQGSLPYMSYWTDTQEEVVDKCLQVLLALLHPGTVGQTNAFWYVLTKITNDRDMAVAVQGCLNFLNNRKNAANTWIPGSQKDLDEQGFVCTLLIKLMQANPMLRDKLCKVVAIKDIISSVIFIIIEDFSLRRGYMGAATLLLYLLSEEPNFGRVLNLPADKLPTTMPLPYGGTWFDAMIVLTHHMASSEVEWITKLVHRLLSCIYHASPSCAAIGEDASVRLIQMFGVYSRQLLGGDLASAPHVTLLLKIMTNLLSFNFQGNLHICVSMLFTSNLTERFEALAQGTGEGASIPAKTRADFQVSMPIRVLKSFEPLYKQHLEANGQPDRDTLLSILRRVNLSGMPEPPEMVLDSPESALEKDRRITKFAWYCIFTHNINPALWPPAAIKVITVKAQER